MNIAPTAGFFGQPVGATSGRLEVGRKRYFNLNDCTYYNHSVGRFYVLSGNEGPFTTGTNAANTADSAFCGGGDGQYVLVGYDVDNYTLTGKRYLNLHECNFLANNSNPNWINNNTNYDSNPPFFAGTNVSNSPNSGASCGPGAGAHFLYNGILNVLDMQDKRYLNWQECIYFAYSANHDFFAVNSTGGGGLSANTNMSNTPDGGPSCAPGNSTHNPAAQNLRVIDLFDTARGKGFIEFKLVANVAPGIYPQSVDIAGTAFNRQKDLGTITVTPTPDNVAIDKKFSNDGGSTFSDSTSVAQGSTFIERLYYNNTGPLVRNGTTINATVPTGFTRVPGSTRNCLQPDPGRICL